MSFLGDLALIIGAIGVIIYMCLIVIRFTAKSARVKGTIKRYEDQVGRLQQRIDDLKERREAMDPEVDELLKRMIGLRERRDGLHFQYEEMVARSKEREIHIKYNAH